MKKIFKLHTFSLIVAMLFVSCETTDFDLQENPNLLNPDNADPEFMLNEMQYLFREIMEDMTMNTDEIMRYEGMTDTYGDVADISVLNSGWERYYEALNLSRALETQASSNPNLIFHNAISKLLMSYLTVTFVDFVGAMPYEQATQPEEFPNPKLDEGPELYKMVLADIDQAIVDIEASTFDVSSDLIYDGDKSKWIAFANSLKLKMLVQSRLASGQIGVDNVQTKINELLASNIIDEPSEDFVFKFAAVEEPESRHPYFQRGYLSGFGRYIGNYFMWMLKDSKNVTDPRIRYYLYRQSDIDPFSGPPYLACQGDNAVDYCYVGDHYWGFDHGETRIGRGDNLLRTTYGIYPAGGAFDEDQFIEASSTSNLEGAGIIPLLTSSYVKFLSAESALVLGTTGDPALLLEDAIRNSMNKVMNFGNVSSSLEPTDADVDAYVSEVIEDFTTAISEAEKLDIIITEFYLAAFGNSIEAYNAYRRTGFPSNIQTPINDDNPTFPRSFPYANSAVLTNSSLSQKLNTEKVFWDTNPDGFIK